jgi:hypothetical protein
MITSRLIRPGKRSDVPVSSLPLPVFGLTLPRRVAAAADTRFASSSSSKREAGLVLSMEALSAFNLGYPRRPSESIESRKLEHACAAILLCTQLLKMLMEIAIE